MSDNVGLGTGILAFAVLALAGWFILSWRQNSALEQSFQWRLFLCAYVLRFCASILLYQFGFVSLIKDEDASLWVMGGVVLERWQQDGVGLLGMPSAMLDVFTNRVGQHRGYYYILAAWFSLLGGPSRLAAAALNGFVGAMTVVLVYRVAALVFSRWVAVRVGWAACLFPSLILWSAQTLKEPIIIFLETLVIYSCMCLRRSGFAVRHIIFSVVPVVMLLPLRFYASYVAGVTVILSLLIPQLREHRSSFRSAFFAIGFMVALAGVSGLQAQKEVVRERFNLEHFQRFRTGIMQVSSSNVELSYDLNTPSGFLKTLVVGGLHLLLAPFPWQWQGASLRLLLTVPESLVWWCLFIVGLIPGMWRIVRQHLGAVQPLILFLLGMGLLYSISFSNIGLAYRQRAQLLPWLLIFAMVGLEQYVLKRRGSHAARDSSTAAPLPLAQRRALETASSLSAQPEPHSRIVPW